MTVLVAKVNEPIIKELYPKANFIEWSKNTSTFNIGVVSFQKLIQKVRENGYNPYALMTW
jgi:predicted proteasome-type protease